MQAFYRLFNGYVLLMTNERASPCLEEALYARREQTRVPKGDGPSRFFSRQPFLTCLGISALSAPTPDGFLISL